MIPIDLSVYLVLDPELCGERGMLETTREAVAGGATVVQLRHKTASTAERIAIGRALQAVMAGTSAQLIINDDVEAACAVCADGLHLGQDDMSPVEARAFIGANMVLGVSVETVAAAKAIDPAVVDYAGAGPIFATATKPDHKPPIGFDGLARLSAAAPVPAVAIGGLNARHAELAMAAGAAGIAVVSAICSAADPRVAAQSIARAIKEARPGSRTF